MRKNYQLIKTKGLFFLTLPQRGILRKVASSTCSLFVAKKCLQAFATFLTNKPRRKNARCGTSILFHTLYFNHPLLPPILAGVHPWRAETKFSQTLVACVFCLRDNKGNKKHVFSHLLKFFSARKSFSLTPLFCFVQRTKSLLRCPVSPRPNKIASTSRRLCFSVRIRSASLAGKNTSPQRLNQFFWPLTFFLLRLCQALPIFEASGSLRGRGGQPYLCLNLITLAYASHFYCSGVAFIARISEITQFFIFSSVFIFRLSSISN